MMLVLSADAERSRAGVIDGERLSWRTEGPKGLAAAAGAARKDLGGTRPEAVAIVFDGEGRTPTWSGVRAAVALGNAMAFAWGIPAVRLSLPADADDAACISAARAAAAKAAKDDRVRAVYDGLPNITTPKRKD